MKEFLNSKIVRLVIIILVIFLLFSIGVNKYLSLKTDLKISEQNTAALGDSVRLIKNKYDKEVFSKKILVAKNKRDLTNLNKRMGKALNELDKANGKVNELTEIIGRIDSGPFDVDNTTVVSLPNNVTAFKWSYNKVFDDVNSRSLEGLTKFTLDTLTNELKPLKTSITRDIINFNVVQGIRTRPDGKVEMFAMSDYPNFEAKELNSAIISPKSHPALKKFTKQKRLKLGVYGGYGATLNLSTSEVIAGPQIGGGAIYTFW